MRPDTYFFNPTCEPAIANGSPFYTAPARLRKFESDLGYLPAWLASDSDQVLVQGTVDHCYNQEMRKLGFRLPELISLKDALANPLWLTQPKGTLRPWGWSPVIHRLFKPAINSYQDDFKRSVVASWQEGHKNLFSRLTALNLLTGMIAKCSVDWLPEPTELPKVCFNLVQIYTELGRRERAVVKTPWSSSGRGLLLFPNPDQKTKNDEVLSGMLNQQGFVTIEPWLEKIVDLSYQFISKTGEISYMGRTFFDTDSKGRYLGNLLTDTPILPEKVSDFLETNNTQVVQLLKAALKDSGYSSLYEGWIGVDALIYKTESSKLRFQPMVEINGRFTMGAIALKLREHLAPGSQGFLQIFFSKSSNFNHFCQKQKAEKPLIIEGQKIVSGFLPLTPPLQEHHFGAYLEVILS
ncbi:MAG: hypothetical protein M0Q53_01065 [Prolixibacteraceae bacterium]|jgi:hypothetical protein|nr:hypothetical protein [Prolixibacteraceae bacterium]